MLSHGATYSILPYPVKAQSWPVQSSEVRNLLLYATENDDPSPKVFWLSFNLSSRKISLSSAFIMKHLTVSRECNFLY